MPSEENLLTISDLAVVTDSGSGQRKSDQFLATPMQTFLPEQPSSPQVFVKVRQRISFENTSIQVQSDGKTLQVTSVGGIPLRNFNCDKIFENEGSDDIFSSVVEEVVEKGMRGVPGIVLSLGTENSEQSLTFYGDLVKYENRGLVPRAFEKIFEITMQKASEVKYAIRLGIVEIRKDKVRDLVSLSPAELKSMGNNGPKGMILQSIDCAEHGYALLLRALTGQKLLASNFKFAKAHTIVFVEIDGEKILSEEERELMGYREPVKFSSRITFAKIASLPQRSKEAQDSTRSESALPQNLTRDNVVHSNGCYFITPQDTPRDRHVVRGQEVNLSDGTQQACCAEKSGLLSQGISIRRDLLFLEQMFVRVSELQKLQRYYHKLKFIGMQGIMRNPNLAPSQYYRQNKLCHCLRDLVSFRNEVRILLHLRPEPEYGPTVLETLRFVDRLRLIPRPTNPEPSDGDKVNDLQFLREEIQSLKDELERVVKSTQLDDGPVPTESRSAFLQTQAADYIEGKLDQLEVTTKAEAKALFENFRTLVQTALTEKLSGSRRGSKRSDLKSAKSGSISKQFPAKPPSEKSLKKSRNRKKSEIRIATKKTKSGKLKSNERNSKLAVPAGETLEAELVTNAVPEEAEDTGEAQERVEGELEQIAEIMGFVSKEEALEGFKKTEIGAYLTEEVVRKEKVVEDKMLEHNSTLESVTDFFQKLSNKQKEFEGIQLARHAKGEEYDVAGNIIISKAEKDALIQLRVMQDTREQVVEKLKSLKLKLQHEKQELSVAKTEFETQFQIFCLDQLAGEVDENTEEEALDVPQGEFGEDVNFCNFFTPRLNPGEVTNKNFDILKRTAKEQAKAIVKYYQSQPPWRQY